MEEIFYMFLKRNKVYKKYLKSFEKENWLSELKIWLSYTKKEDWIISAFVWDNSKYWGKLDDKWRQLLDNINTLLKN